MRRRSTTNPENSKGTSRQKLIGDSNMPELEIDLQEITKKNLEALAKSNEQAAQVAAQQLQQWIALPPEKRGNYKVIQARNGALIPVYINEDGKEVLIHSKIDPFREAKSYIDSLKIERQNFFLALGIGFAYHLNEAMDHFPEGSKFYIYEQDISLFMYALTHVDLTKIFSYKRLHLVIGADPLEFVTELGRDDSMNFMQGFIIIELPSYQHLPQIEAHNLAGEKFRVGYFQYAGNFQSLMLMTDLILENTLLNWDAMLKYPPIKGLFGQFKGVPGIIISAGPSLTKQLELLHEVKDRAVLIGVDTSTKPLLANGISPHLVCTGDPQEANYRHLKNVDMPNAYLVTEGQAPPKSIREWTGGHFMCSYGDRLMKVIETIIHQFGHVHTWGSVATMAYDLALKLGCDPIIFIGQDLSFSGGRTYVPGTYFETEEKKQMTVDELRDNKINLVDTTDIYGNPTTTNRQMFSYLEFFMNRFNDKNLPRLINATEGGILKHDKVEQMTFRDVLDKVIGGDQQIKAKIDSLFEATPRPDPAGVGLRLNMFIAKWREMLNISLTGMKEVIYQKKELDDLITSEEQMQRRHDKFFRLRKQMLNDEGLKLITEQINQKGLFSFFRNIRDIDINKEIRDRNWYRAYMDAYGDLFVTTYQKCENIIPLLENARTITEDLIIKRKKPVNGNRKPS